MTDGSGIAVLSNETDAHSWALISRAPDMRLRPYGDAGPMASSIEHLEQYYSPSGQASPFERQALIKLRRIAGDPAL